jgi:hypothetical protein
MSAAYREEARRLARSAIRGAFKPEALHAYTDEKGRPIYWRIRARLQSGEKWIRPMRRNGIGYEFGEPQFPDGKPLYRLHELVARPGAPCWYVEGENCVDALAKLGILATTAGGATSDERADFVPLAGRAVTIWPDNDKAGIGHADRVAAKLRALGCVVDLIDVRPLGLEDGGDCVDWLRAHPGASAADLATLPRLRAARGRQLPAENVSGLVLRCIADVEPRPVRWLWPGRIARGKVFMLAGHPGLGKSQLCVSIATIVTTGGLWPVDRTRSERGTVLIFSAEDDPEDTIRPRLEAAGADLTRVHVLEAVAVREADGSMKRRGFSLAEDMPRLAAKLAEMQDVALVIIDPISAFLGDTDSHQNAAVRAVLAPLADVAAKHGAAVIAVSHLRKSTAGEPMHNITGSLAFVAAARAAYIVAKDQADPQRRLLLPAKNNLGDDQTGYAFRIEPATLPSGIATSRVTWELERVTVTAEEALAPPEDREERSALEEAADFLRAILADAPVPAKKVYAEANDAGHSQRTIRRAAKAAGVEQFKDGMKGGWLWKLAPKVAQTPEDVQGETLATFDEGGPLREADPIPEAPPTGEQERF